ncbi:MFS general substrate transporter [Plenodomus tracheiphilus IPT5]|uniref:MFS general substrate transporter n=1 Tax=Plenodomus tracheiphilus IPT5 TaxID=1408161 RepID=A0A6A7B155_9PLEO|nr:MFS general substrate transporter [Plenodomus tracheiphilus IPT5]
MQVSSGDTSVATSEKLPSNEQYAREPESQLDPEPKVNNRTITGFKWVLVVCGVLSSTFLFSLDMSIVADVQPKIVGTFGEIEKLPWLSVAFALGTAATSLIWASVYTFFDGKWNYLIALFLFEVGSAICGAANMMDVLIFGRALAGVGGAGLYVGVLTLLSTLTNATERPLYLASIGLLWGAGSVLGPVIGGAFADSPATWRWSFYINLVVAAVFAPVYLFILPSTNPRPDMTFMQKATKMDYVGAILFMTAFCCGITGLSMGGLLFPWDSATTVVLLVISFVTFIAFGIQQAWSIFTTPEQRLFPIHYFRTKTLALIFFLSCAGAPPIIVPVYFLSLFFQLTKGDTAMDAAVKLLPFIFMSVLFSLLNGGIMGKEGHYAPWYLLASPLIITGAALMYTVDEHSSNSEVYGYSALLGIGAGCLIQVGFIVAQAIVPRSEMSLSVAFINLSQMTGMVVGLTVANVIFLNLAQTYIQNVLPNADPDQIKSAISGTGSAFIGSLTVEDQARVLHAITDAISKPYLFLAVVAAIQFILSLFLKWERVFLEM